MKISFTKDTENTTTEILLKLRLKFATDKSGDIVWCQYSL